MTGVLVTSTYPNQCWHNRTVVDSFVPYHVTHDEECDKPVTEVVLVPTYMEQTRGETWPEYWPTLSCADHLAALLKDFTSDEGHGYPAEELITTTVKPKEGEHGTAL